MSFLQGFGIGILKSADAAIKRDIARTREYNEEINKIKFNRQMNEKDEWDDDVEEAQKALENGAAAFRNPTTGELDPRAMAFAASALKRSGSLSDYNAFMANIKKAQADGDINAVDYFDQLPQDFEIGSAKDYAQAFVGPMSDYTDVESYSIKTPALTFLGKILGKPIDSRKQSDKKLQLKLKAAGFDKMTVNSDVVLPTIRFLDYKFDLDQQKPLDRLNTISNELAKPEISEEKKEYYLNARKENLETIKLTGTTQQKMDANDYEVSLLDPINDLEEIMILKEENTKLQDSMDLIDLRNKPLELLGKQIEIKYRELQTAQGDTELNAAEKASKISSIRDELVQLNTEREILKNYGYDTIGMQIKRAEEDIERKLSGEGYANSSEYNIDITALTNLKNKAAERDFAINGLNSSAMAGVEREYKTFLATELSQNPELNTKVQDLGGGNVKYLVDEPEIRTAYAAFVLKTKQDFFQSRLDDFSFYEYPELFAVAEKNGVMPTKQQKLSRYSFPDTAQQSDVVVSSNEVEANVESNAENQTNNILNKDENIILSTEQKQFQSTYPLNKEGINKLLELKADIGKTPEKFIEDLEYYYPNKTITDSIKNQINNYFENKDTTAALEETYEIPKEKAIGDDFFAATVDLAKKGSSKFKNMLSAMASKGSVDGTVNAAKTDYYDTDADAESKKFILEELAKYLKRKNYSEDRIQKIIEKIKNPANLKKASGGLMSKKG
jgi:hypothetical protein